MSADDFDRADAIFQLERRWQSHLKKLRQQLLKDADKPLTQDRQIVEDVLELIGGAVTIEDGIKRPIGRGDVEGALYHMRQAIEATRRVQARQTKPTKRAMNRLIAALRKAGEFPTTAANGKAGEFPTTAANGKPISRNSVLDDVLRTIPDDALLAECQRRGLKMEAGNV